LIVGRRAKTHLAALLVTSALALLAVPSLGRASSGSGGTGFGASPTTTFATAAVHLGDVTTTATDGGITLSARVSALLRHVMHFTGVVPASDAGQKVIVERFDRVQGWLRTASGVAGPDGSFSIPWHTNHIGRFAIRALLLRGSVAGLRAASNSPTVNVTVYLPAIASWYGPGSWGSTTACGNVLKPGTFGVAHRWLKCGTPVALYYGGRTIVVPVIDRGPYANHADWDLTEATAQVLHMDGVATIGAVSLPASAPTSSSAK
jgi:peptidoglycan lytic transglycosylase